MSSGGIQPRIVGLDEAAECRGIVVVVDVLRAFTTTAMAFLRGVERIHLAGSVEQARDVASGRDDILLAGEQDTRPVPGFDLSNSPVEMVSTSRDLRGSQLVMVTTSGTRATVAAASADQTWCTGFVSAVDLARHLGDGVAVTYVASGRSRERARIDDGGDDAAVAALVEQLRHGDGSRVAAARTAVLASRHAERLRRGGDAAADLLLATADPRMAPAMVVGRAGPTGVVLLPADRR